MESKNLLTLAITLTVGIILAGSLLMPVISDAQLTAGSATTLTNEKYATENYKYTIWDGSDIVLAYTPSPDINTPGVYTVDGEQVTLLGISQRIIIASNDFASRAGGTAVSVLNSQFVDSAVQLGNTAFTFTIEDKAYTLELGSNTYTGTVDWLVYATDDGSANLIQVKDVSSPFYTSYKDKIVVLGNIYTTGDNDTFYSYFNGDLTVNSAYADNSSVDLTKTRIDGYTDIYDTTITVNVGDESFTPYFILAPETVNGHEADATFSLLGVLPILVIIGLLVAAMGAIYSKRDD